MKTKFELADVIRRFGQQLIKQKGLTPVQMKTLFNIVQCRTASLGGHEEACDCCGVIRYSFNSCGNRHCPKCQLAKQLKWIDKLINKTLPIRHYHLVFTVPHCLNNIAIWDPRLYYKILFKTTWQVLQSFGYTHFGVESGAVMVLHTWGQNLSLHPHLHCIVPAAGYTLDGKWKHIGTNGLYLYPVHQLSQAFKYQFLTALKRELKKGKAYTGFYDQVQTAYSKQWVVYSEPALANAEHVIKYLGQYTHRVAISNQHILNITNTHVEFVAKDYRDNAKKKPVSLSGGEFLRRFCQHILPERFIKIRYYGVYNATTKRRMQLQFKPLTIDDIQSQSEMESETTLEAFKRILNIDINLCSVCKKGTMQKVRELPRIRSPNNHIPTLLIDLLK